jgi:hypothetical protein
MGVPPFAGHPLFILFLVWAFVIIAPSLGAPNAGESNDFRTG